MFLNFKYLYKSLFSLFLLFFLIGCVQEPKFSGCCIRDTAGPVPPEGEEGPGQNQCHVRLPNGDIIRYDDSMVLLADGSYVDQPNIPQGAFKLHTQSCDLEKNTCNVTFTDNMNNVNWMLVPICTEAGLEYCVNANCTVMVCGNSEKIFEKLLSVGDVRGMLDEEGAVILDSSSENDDSDGPQGVYKNTCQFLPMDEDTSRMLASSGNAMWVNSFRFGIGGSIDDFESSRYYMPLIDDFCGDPTARVDRYLNYLGDYYDESNSCSYKGPYFLFETGHLFDTYLNCEKYNEENNLNSNCIAVLYTPSISRYYHSGTKNLFVNRFCKNNNNQEAPLDECIEFKNQGVIRIKTNINELGMLYLDLEGGINQQHEIDIDPVYVCNKNIVCEDILTYGCSNEGNVGSSFCNIGINNCENYCGGQWLEVATTCNLNEVEVLPSCNENEIICSQGCSGNWELESNITQCNTIGTCEGYNSFCNFNSNNCNSCGGTWVHFFEMCFNPSCDDNKDFCENNCNANWVQEELIQAHNFFECQSKCSGLDLIYSEINSNTPDDLIPSFLKQNIVFQTQEICAGVSGSARVNCRNNPGMCTNQHLCPGASLTGGECVDAYMDSDLFSQCTDSYVNENEQNCNQCAGNWYLVCSQNQGVLCSTNPSACAACGGTWTSEIISSTEYPDIPYQELIYPSVFKRYYNIDLEQKLIAHTYESQSEGIAGRNLLSLAGTGSMDEITSINEEYYKRLLLEQYDNELKEGYFDEKGAYYPMAPFECSHSSDCKSGYCNKLGAYGRISLINATDNKDYFPFLECRESFDELTFSRIPRCNLVYDDPNTPEYQNPILNATFIFPNGKSKVGSSWSPCRSKCVKYTNREMESYFYLRERQHNFGFLAIIPVNNKEDFETSTLAQKCQLEEGVDYFYLNSTPFYDVDKGRFISSSGDITRNSGRTCYHSPIIQQFYPTSSIPPFPVQINPATFDELNNKEVYEDITLGNLLNSYFPFFTNDEDNLGEPIYRYTNDAGISTLMTNPLCFFSQDQRSDRRWLGWGCRSDSNTRSYCVPSTNYIFVNNTGACAITGDTFAEEKFDYVSIGWCESCTGSTMFKQNISAQIDEHTKGYYPASVSLVGSDSDRICDFSMVQQTLTCRSWNFGKERWVGQKVDNLDDTKFPFFIRPNIALLNQYVTNYQKSFIMPTLDFRPLLENLFAIDANIPFLRKQEIKYDIGTFLNENRGAMYIIIGDTTSYSNDYKDQMIELGKFVKEYCPNCLLVLDAGPSESSIDKKELGEVAEFFGIDIDDETSLPFLSCHLLVAGCTADDLYNLIDVIGIGFHPRKTYDEHNETWFDEMRFIPNYDAIIDHRLQQSHYFLEWLNKPSLILSFNINHTVFAKNYDVTQYYHLEIEEDSVNLKLKEYDTNNNLIYGCSITDNTCENRNVILSPQIIASSIQNLDLNNFYNNLAKCNNTVGSCLSFNASNTNTKLITLTFNPNRAIESKNLPQIIYGAIEDNFLSELLTFEFVPFDWYDQARDIDFRRQYIGRSWSFYAEDALAFAIAQPNNININPITGQATIGGSTSTYNAKIPLSFDHFNGVTTISKGEWYNVYSNINLSIDNQMFMTPIYSRNHIINLNNDVTINMDDSLTQQGQCGPSRLGSSAQGYFVNENGIINPCPGFVVLEHDDPLNIPGRSAFMHGSGGNFELPFRLYDKNINNSLQYIPKIGVTNNHKLSFITVTDNPFGKVEIVFKITVNLKSEDGSLNKWDSHNSKDMILRIFERQNDLVEKGILGLFYDPWRTEFPDTRGLEIGGITNLFGDTLDHYKDEKFDAFMRASKYVMGSNKYITYVEVYAQEDSCTCIPCTRQEINLGLCNEICVDGKMCYPPEDFDDTIGYKCPSGCMRRNESTLCEDSPFTSVVCKIVHNYDSRIEYYMMKGSQYSIANNFATYADVISVLPYQDKCAGEKILGTDEGEKEIYTYLGDMIFSSKSTPILYSKIGDSNSQCPIDQDDFTFPCELNLPIKEKSIVCYAFGGAE